MQTPPRPGGLLLEALPLPPTPDSAPRRASLLAQELEEIAPALTKRMREGTPPEVCVLAAIRQAALVRAPVTQVNDFTVVSLSASGRTKTVVFSPPVEHSFATLDLSSRWTSSITATLAQVTLRDVGFTLDDLAAPRLPNLSTVIVYNCRVNVTPACQPFSSVERLVVAASRTVGDAVLLSPRIWPSVRHLGVLTSPGTGTVQHPLQRTLPVEFDLHSKPVLALAHQLRTLAASPLHGNTGSIEALRNLSGLALPVHRVEDALLQNMDDEGNCRIQPVDFPWLRSLRLLAPVDQDVTSDDEDSSWMSAHRRVVRLIHAEEQVEQRRSRRRWQSSSRRNCDSSSETDSEAEDWRTCTVHFPALTKLVLAAANRLAGSKRWSPGIGLEVRGWESALSVLASVETGRRALVVD